MTTQTQVKEFDWVGELHQTMVKSLATSFGLDFLLFQDKRGGNVDTVHKVREYQKELQKNGKTDIHVSKEISVQLTSDGKNAVRYDSHAYHADDRYIKRGQQDKKLQDQGQLHDAYRNRNMAEHEKRQLDHVIAASEIHHDAGRILSGLDGVELANQETNFQSTQGYINTKKSDMSVEEFIAKLPEMKRNKEDSIAQKKKQLANIPENTPANWHKRQRLKDEIRKEQEHLEALESVNETGMRNKDKQARDAYDQQINWSYYTSSKFFGSAAIDMGKQGFKMGLRQSVGIVLAEIWFELRDRIPKIFAECKQNFQLENFFNHIKEAFNGIWEGVKKRFKELLNAFKDGLISGIISSATTTLWNAFQTIGGNAIKIIRETWVGLAKAVKLIFFNPEKLKLGDLIREVTRILGNTAALAAGALVHKALVELPLGIPEFLSALVYGVLAMGLSYFLDHSEIMQKVWSFLNSRKSQYEKILERYQEINAELDHYLMELSKIEFNMNPTELEQFANDLSLANDEFQRHLVLHKEIVKRNIELPFEAGNADSIRQWLINIQAKNE